MWLEKINIFLCLKILRSVHFPSLTLMHSWSFLENSDFIAVLGNVVWKSCICNFKCMRLHAACYNVNLSLWFTFVYIATLKRYMFLSLAKLTIEYVFAWSGAFCTGLLAYSRAYMLACLRALRVYMTACSYTYVSTCLWALCTYTL